MQDNILLTGSSGYLGREILSEFERLQTSSVRIDRKNDSDIICDLSKSIPDLSQYKFSKIVHAAGKAHIIPKTEAEKKDFFNINLTGTSNLIKGLEQSLHLPDCFIFISTVSVYGQDEGEMIDENTMLMANDAYGKSKIEAEKIIIEWCRKKNVKYFIFRLPLIAAPNAPGNLGAMVRGIETGKYLSIGKANAKKSIVLANDVAHLIVTINGESGIYNLTDGYHPTFKELENKIALSIRKKNPVSIPLFIAKLLGIAGDIIGQSFPVDSKKIKKIVSTLTFSDEKARKNLNWKPEQVLANWKIK